MKVLLVIPKIKSLFGKDNALVSHPHIGVAYLVAYLKQNGINVKVFDDSIHKISLEQMLIAYSPDFVGITLFSYCCEAGYDLIKRINANFTIPIVVGGPHVSIVGKDIFDETIIDFAIKGEGEQTFLELLQLKDHSTIKGLIWRNSKCEIIENEPRPYNTNLDALPFPDYKSFGIEDYICHQQKSIPIITSRGCPYGCNYCSVGLCMGHQFRARSPQNVFDEIKELYAQGYRTFDINDDCFTLDMQRADDICELIISSGLKIKFQLYNGIRVDRVSLSLLMKMKRAGCFFVSYGCEAGTDKILRAIKKGICLEQVRNAVDWANIAGIPNAVNFIIGHKEETYQDALQTLAFAKSLSTNFVNFYNLLPYPGTESYEWAEKNATLLIPKEKFLTSVSYRDNVPLFETKEFTKAQRQVVVKKGLELYKRKMLEFRFGKIGLLVYCLTKIKSIEKFLLYFALDNKKGKRIYQWLARRSYE